MSSFGIRKRINAQKIIHRFDDSGYPVWMIKPPRLIWNSSDMSIRKGIRLSGRIRSIRI